MFMKKQHYFIGLISTIGLMVLHCSAFASGVVDYLGPMDTNIHLSTLLYKIKHHDCRQQRIIVDAEQRGRCLI